VKKRSLISVALVIAALVIAAAGACSSNTGGTAVNSVGHSAAVVLTVQLRADITSDAGVSLTKRINDVSGVAYTQYTPGGYLTVGVVSGSGVQHVEDALHTEPAVVSTSSS